MRGRQKPSLKDRSGTGNSQRAIREHANRRGVAPFQRCGSRRRRPNSRLGVCAAWRNARSFVKTAEPRSTGARRLTRRGPSSASLKRELGPRVNAAHRRPIDVGGFIAASKAARTGSKAREPTRRNGTTVIYRAQLERQLAKRAVDKAQFVGGEQE